MAIAACARLTGRQSRSRLLSANLTDVQLVLAQGKENTERRDLSFIERAFFARNLVERGFERGLVQDALSLDKAEMTQFPQVAAAVPALVVRAIGPAPKIGRPRWVRFAELLKSDDAREAALDEIALVRSSRSTATHALTGVFERLMKHAESCRRRDARARYSRSHNQSSRSSNLQLFRQGRQVLTFRAISRTDFAAFVAGELEALLSRY